MYEFECLTKELEYQNKLADCAPFFGECFPVGEGCCGPDCDPSY